MGLIRWIFAIAVLAVWTSLIGTSLYVAMYEPKDALPEGAAIVVVSGAQGETGGMGPETVARVERAIALYEDGKAPKIVLSGGTATSNAPVAEAMRDLALEAGVPEDALILEGGSHSTLQNAIFTADIAEIEKAAPILLVSHRYHLPRANASFRWAGFTDVTNVAADPAGGFQVTMPLLWESV
ncbi:MAG: YdcF family protein, partial [Paracoccaceae bacterium]|nr:YdcF family protein [Paracoccaceae bacterium]